MATDYKATVTLPKTDFAMKANLPEREPKFLERWDRDQLYAKILKQNENSPLFLLHDGPPYANANIHLGHVMNKTLKDMVVKSKTMSGFRSPYIPGWDCHGLPIEHQVIKQLGPKAKTLSKAELRKECRTYADKFVEIQKAEFKRLGVFGDWDHPYRTMDFSYQAQIAREFGKVVQNGYVYRNRRSIHWCVTCQTALAEAEIEYADHTSPSIFVAYPLRGAASEGGKRFALIWTTTPWTLPASMAIAYAEEEEYVWVELAGTPGQYLVAEKLIPNIVEALGIAGQLKVVGSFGKGEGLSKLEADHPWIKRTIPFLSAAHVTMDSGTGLVHTAPGHGEEDYELGRAKGIEIYSPVLEDGRFDKTVEGFEGLKVFEANPKIVGHLKQLGRLFVKEVPITHSYPHCWRCKKPVIFRATEQWFISLSHQDLRKKALEDIDRVTWVPSWGRERIYGMISARPDWCISRQRVWGVPIIAFFCKGCGESYLSAESVFRVADLFEKEGADVWFLKDAKELLPTGTICAKCSGTEFEKGSDILDVWFDSGASHAAVIERDKSLGWPADVYLEGSDQHRGWFHSSLLEGIATRGRAPYKAVITHGFVVDGEGKKMSKSVGNVLSLDSIVKVRGVDIVRLWIATEDYRGDNRLSNEILERVAESYRRIRNTARFCLGNFSDFNPEKDSVPREKLAREMDRWAMDRLANLSERLQSAYERYEYHMVIQALNEFCVVDMSSLYMDVAKDLLYCDAPEGLRRRSVQTVLFEVARTMALYLAPILPFTAEDIWDFLPVFPGKSASVHLAAFPRLEAREDAAFHSRWDTLLQIRAEVSKALEGLRQKKTIGQSLEAEVHLVLPAEMKKVAEASLEDLAPLMIVSRVSLVNQISGEGFETSSSEAVPGLSVGVRRVTGERCERCWTYAADRGVNSAHPTLCGRCAGVVS